MSTRPSILVVDDDPDLLRLLTIRLESAGYAVTAASSAERALAQLAVVRPAVVVTDLRMGAMDGLALFDQVRKNYPTLPVIILTAHGTIPDAVDATRRGVFGYLTKPVDPQQLLTEVGRAAALGTSSAIQAPRPARGLASIITRNARMQELIAEARLAAGTDAHILIRGGPGSGKEELARAIHEDSPRNAHAWVAVHCAAMTPDALDESLFGKGPDGAASASWQAAQDGTLFLQDVDDIPLALQAKLLQALRQPTASAAQKAPVRVIASTRGNLQAAAADGAFRDELYYALSVVTLQLPPLAERRDDIPLLAGHFLRELSDRYERAVSAFSPEAMSLLVAADWPGNVRQLRSVVERVVTLATAALVPADVVQDAIAHQSRQFVSLEEARKRFEHDYLVQLLKLTGGNVTQAARLAHRNRTEFYKLLQRHSLEPAAFKARAH